MKKIKIFVLFCYTDKRLVILIFFFDLKILCDFTETPNLECIQTVESIKLASAINNSCQRKGLTNKMKVFAQVNSSGEDSKFYLFV